MGIESLKSICNTYLCNKKSCYSKTCYKTATAFNETKNRVAVKRVTEIKSADELYLGSILSPESSAPGKPPLTLNS
jgi:hypothetical protein